MKSCIQTYAEELRAYCDEQNRLHRLKQETEAKLGQPRRRVKPLDVQITELMSTLPPQLRDRPWSMQELVSRLSGTYRNHPHGKNVGAILRSLGWRRVRLWSNGADGQRVWIPSGTDTFTG